MKGSFSPPCVVIAFAFQAFLFAASSSTTTTAVPNQTNSTQNLPSPASSNGLSASNVFSTFLALCLCCLTQPYGSLLFIRRGGWYWRLSPISAVIETLIILWCMVSQRIPNFGSLVREERLTEEDGRNHSTPQALLPHQTESLPLQQENSATDGLWIKTRNLSSVILKMFGLTHGWRTMAGALLLLRGGKFNPGDELDPVTIRQELAIEHNWRIQIWTTVTVSFLFIKLFVVTGAPLFTIVGLCFGFAWLSVQTLLLLVLWAEWSDVEINTIIRQYRNLGGDSSAPTWAWETLWAVLNLGLLCGLAYYGFFGSSRGQRVFFITQLVITELAVVFIAINQSFDNTRYYTTTWDRGFVFLFALSTSGLLFALPWWLCWDDYCLRSDADGFWKIIGKGVAALVRGFAAGYIIIGILVIIGAGVGAAGFGFFLERFSGIAVRSVVSGVNLVVFALAMAFYLFNYDSTGTYRPGWLDWIGM